MLGAIISATTYTITALTSGATFSWGGLATATFIGAASAAVTFGIGTAALSISGGTFAKTRWRGFIIIFSFG